MRTGVGRPGKRAQVSNAGKAPGTRADSARGDQRSRLLDGIVDVVAHDGYPDARIGDVAKHAGVSRATFYELFGSKESCLVAAQRAVADRLTAVLTAAIADGEPDRAAQSALGYARGSRIHRRRLKCFGKRL